MADLKALLEKLRSYAGEIKDKPGYYLDHSRWHAEHGHGGYPDSTVWFHGTRYPFEEFDLQHAGSVSRNEWNTHVGFHFTHSLAVANRFGNSAGPARRIIPVRLSIQNPKVYGSEDEMNMDATKATWHISKGERLGRLPNEKKHELAEAYRNHIRAQGHDGIIYPPYEGGIAAIPFGNDQIHEVYGHGDKTRRFADPRSYAATFKDRQGYVLTGEVGKRRWRADERHDAHHPAKSPPRLLQMSELTGLYSAPEGMNDAQVMRHADGSLRYVKHGSELEPHKEVAASTVLGSLGFRVPGVDVVADGRGTAVASRSLGTQDAPVVPYHAAPDAVKEWMTFQVDEDHPYDLYWDGDPRDKMDQRLAAALVNDRDRNSGNIMYDEHNRRWDIDFGLQSEPGGPGDTTTYHQWLSGLDPFQTEQIADNVREVLDAHHQAGKDLTPLLRTINHIASPEAEQDFEWLRHADHAPYKRLGFDNPHTGVIQSLRTLSPDLLSVSKDYE